MRSTYLRHAWLVVGLLLLSACLAGPVPQRAASSGVGFKVAMLLPGALDDQGWNQHGYAALHAIEAELHAEIAYQAQVPTAEQERLLYHYADTGYHFVIGLGSEYITATEKIARYFPRTKFAVTADYVGNNANLGALALRDWELGYLVGTVAALKSRSGKLAVVTGTASGAGTAVARAIANGARAVRPDSDVVVRVSDHPTDRAHVRMLAEQEVARGVDVLIAHAGVSQPEIIAVAREHGVYAIGWSQDQHQLAPQTVLTSAVQHLPALLLQAATLVKEGRWEGKRYSFGLRDGMLDLAPFYGLLSTEETAVVTRARDAIISGNLVVEP